MNLSTSERFDLLDQLLSRHWMAWQPTFGHSEKHWLDSVSLATVKSQLKPLISLPRSQLPPIKSEPPAGMKLRKWQQIAHFRDSFSSSAESVVDWCCGMGHLSRHLAGSDQSVVGLEIDYSLVMKAKAASSQSAVFYQCDVLNDSAKFLSTGQSFVALHACGSLHTTLVETVVRAQANDLHLAPCCYHKRFDQGLKTLSQTAKLSDLKLDERNIQLAVRQSVTAAKRELLAREKLRLYRLAFDEWVKRELGIGHYTPLPSISSAISAGGLDAFCQWGAEQRVPQLKNRAVKDHSALLARAKLRLKQEVAYEAQCNLFRRALEIRLCLDNVLFLEENGFNAEIFEFCSPSITPRNILIRAFKR